MKKINTLTSAILFAFAPIVVQAGLIQNGSFEDLGGQTFQHSNWGYFATVPGWVGVDHLEIHKGNGSNTFVTPADGAYYAELNAHPAQQGSFEFSQTFATTMNTVYSLEFFAQKRKNGDGSFSFSVGNLVNEVINSHVKDDWTSYVYKFTATSDSTTLGFLSGQGGDDTTGHYLDNISVTAVPEPSSLALLAGGVIGLAFLRRRSS